MPLKPAARTSGLTQQIRNSVDQGRELQNDAMNLDDFIVPTSMASPAGLTSEAPMEDSMELTGIPINKRAKTPTQAANMPPASMPKNAIARNRNGEFDYVQRRVRKTSIDDRSVSLQSWRCAIQVLTP